MKSTILSILSIAAGVSLPTASAAVLVSNPGLGGTSQYVSWDAATTSGGDLDAGGALSNLNPSGTPTAGVGSTTVTSPGFRSTLGYYSFGGHFGMTATTSIQDSAFSDIQSVVFQRVSMQNPDYTNQQALDLNGGATLSLFDSSDNLIASGIAATVSWVGAESLDGGAAGFTGTYYNYIYQWDLSAYGEDVYRVTVNSPIIVHSSTVEARLDIGSSSIPEPASVMLVGLGGGLLLLRRRI